VNDQAARALAEAIRLAEHGYRLTPVTITRLPSGKKGARFHKGWRHEGAWSNDPELIRQWWVDHPDTSFALGGGANGIEGVDLDVKPELGVDAVEWWNAQGLPGSAFTQATPSGGVHLIWRANPDRGLPQEAGKTFGKGVDTRNRSGLFFAAGAYVVGEPGHYECLADLVKLEDLPFTPPVVLDRFADHGRAAPADRPTDGRIVPHDEEWQQRVVAEAVQAIRDHDRNAGGYRAKLMGAGLLLGRAVEQGFLDQPRALAILMDAHRSLWGDSVWPENLADMRAALADGPRLERWRVPEPQPVGGLVSPGPTEDPEQPASVHDHVQGSSYEQPNPITSTNGGTWDVAPGEDGYDPDAKAAEYEARELDKDIKRERRRRTARRVVDAEDREPLRVLDGLAFLRAPTPEYLVPDMLMVNSSACVFGPPGGTKSFFVLDLALCLATGRPWRGKPLGRHRVHYVMAEGQAVNTVRALGWLHHFAPDLDHDQLQEWLTVIPQGILLTPEGVAEYLVHVERDAPALIILDTKNRMMVGNENDAGDNGVLNRAMDAIRNASGRACVLLVDHTGLGDTSRRRGSNAGEGASDTEVRVTMDNGVATAEVTRNKAAEPGASWSYRLRAVKDVPGLRPGTPDPAVCVTVDADEVAALTQFDTDPRAWMNAPVPQDVAEYATHGAVVDGKRTTKGAPDVGRMAQLFMDRGRGSGLTRSQAVGMLNDGRDREGRKARHAALVKAWDALLALGRLESVSPSGGEQGAHRWVARPDDDQPAEGHENAPDASAWDA